MAGTWGRARGPAPLLRSPRPARFGPHGAGGTPAIPGVGGGVGQELHDSGEDDGAGDTKMEATKE